MMMTPSGIRVPHWLPLINGIETPGGSGRTHGMHGGVQGWSFQLYGQYAVGSIHRRSPEAVSGMPQATCNTHRRIRITIQENGATE